jgi:hypothetical protein
VDHIAAIAQPTVAFLGIVIPLLACWSQTGELRMLPLRALQECLRFSWKLMTMVEDVEAAEVDATAVVLSVGALVLLTAVLTRRVRRTLRARRATSHAGA